MSKMSRLEMLKSFTEQEPENPFNWYALALEYKELDLDQSIELFSKLLKQFPAYLPTYYQAAEVFADLGKISEANGIYINGIKLAQSQQNNHALRELKNAYQNFQFENDLDD
ncbi:hypothetical protein A33Q_1139 [Indibacter alkaliphilus LW1]|uniref:Enzyme of heme biosynthesis n=2 Tax=Indibacter TaxID=647744 RepID=S2DMQ6_INDAL|nr:hypothetical protein A33Q_1139 [Indibacter alkaliphilus LW1]